VQLKALEHIRTPLLIIGAGLAGCRAAIAAVDAGLRGEDVLILNEGRFLTSGSSFYPLARSIGYSASLPDLIPEDSPEVHFQDVMRAGAATCDHRLVRILTREAESRLRDLMRFGVSLPLIEAGKQPEGKGLCFNSHRRGDGARMEDLRAAFSEGLAKRGIRVRDRCYVASLLGDSGCCRGALAITHQGQPLVIEAGATILATGGASPIFRHFKDTPELSGDGYMLALRLGARLVNLEFYQITWGIVHPPGAVLPAEVSLYNNPAMEGKLPRFLNKLGVPFFERYLPPGLSLTDCIDVRLWHGPFSSQLVSKWFDIGIFTEIKEGRGTPHQGVWADFRGLVPEPQTRETHDLVAGHFRPRVVDPWQAPVEMSLFVHAFNGGVRIREHGETSVPNLYACGEVAGGPHGADRLGGMAFAATQVFGARAGQAAAERALSQPAPNPDPAQVEQELSVIKRRLSPKEGPSVQQVRRRIRDTMWWNAMICQDEAGLACCLKELDEIADRDLPRVGVRADSDLFRALELSNLWQTAQIVATLSRERKETRGPHYRTDYPEPREAYAGSYAVDLSESSPPGERLAYVTRLVNLTSE